MGVPERGLLRCKINSLWNYRTWSNISPSFQFKASFHTFPLTLTQAMNAKNTQFKTEKVAKSQSLNWLSHKKKKKTQMEVVLFFYNCSWKEWCVNDYGTKWVFRFWFAQMKEHRPLLFSLSENSFLHEYGTIQIVLLSFKFVGIC